MKRPKSAHKFFKLSFEPSQNVTESVRQVQSRTLLVFLALSFILAFTAIIQEYQFYSTKWTATQWNNYLIMFLVYQSVLLLLIILLKRVVTKQGPKMYRHIETITIFAAYFLSFQVALVTIIGMYHNLNMYVICGATAGYSTMLLLTNKQRIIYLLAIYSSLALGVKMFIEMPGDLYAQLIVSLVIITVIFYTIGYFSFNWYTSNIDKTLKLEASQDFQMQMLNQWAKDLNVAPVNSQKETSLVKLNEQVYKLLDTKVASEKKLKKTLKNLQDANKSLEGYAYAVSHDLKTPLRGISTLAYFLNEDFGTSENPQIGELTGGILEKIEYMDKLISDLLVYSEIKNTNQTFDLNVAEELRTCIQQQDAPDNCSITLTGDFPNIRIDQKHFQILVANILSNAIKYNDKEEIKVVITGEDKGKEIQLSFKDNGKGIKEAYHIKIFELFQSIDKTDQNSTGFGLAIAQKIVKLYAGSISLTSEVGEGSTFIVSLKK